MRARILCVLLALPLFLLRCSGSSPSPDGGLPSDSGTPPSPDGGNPVDAGPAGISLDGGLLLDYTFRTGATTHTATSIFQVFTDGRTYHEEQTCCPQTSVVVDSGVIDPTTIQTIIGQCTIVQSSTYTDGGLPCPTAGCSQGHLNCVFNGVVFTEENYIALPLHILNIETVAPEGLVLLHWVDNYVTQQLP